MESREMFEGEKGREAPETQEAVETLLWALSLILPLAKGYAAAHRVVSNAEYIRHAENVLETFGGPGFKTGVDPAITDARYASMFNPD